MIGYSLLDISERRKHGREQVEGGSIEEKRPRTNSELQYCFPGDS